jgi:glycosyltransferase involved in cell wall biosynthesis
MRIRQEFGKRNSMKVYINRKPIIGPWGGGNRVVVGLSQRLVDEGHKVQYTLNSEDPPDIIFCMDPRPNNLHEWYQTFLHFKAFYGAKIIQRVGDVGTHGKPHLTSLVQDTVQMSDFLIFPSRWAKKIAKYDGNNYRIVENAPLKDFHDQKNTTKQSLDKVRLVTHHWSTNLKKGFDVYKHIDRNIVDDNIHFTYIGATPRGFIFKNTNHIGPVGNPKQIAKLLSDNNVYLTASEEEAGANHILEGMAVGLPVLFHENGGSIVEYVNGAGISYATKEEIPEALTALKNSLSVINDRVLDYNRSIDDVMDEYMEIIDNVV